MAIREMHMPLSRVIATLVFEETVPWARMLIKSIRKHSDLPVILFAVGRDIPFLGEDGSIALDLERLWKKLPYDRVNRGVNDKAKSLIFPILQKQYGTEEVLYIDADCLVLKPFEDIFECKGEFLMARERLDFYEKYLTDFGCLSPKLTLNGGVMLFRKSCFDLWSEWYEKLFSRYNEEHAEGQTVWNLVWHTHYQRMTHEVLPQRYNQLHVKHGPHGAVIYHLAGLSNNMKMAVMSNLFTYFFGEEP